MKKLNLHLSVVAILFSLLSHQALSTDVSSGYKAKIEMDFLLAPIKNEVDLENYLAITPIDNSPLRVLPEIERDIFINSLVFTKKGLASFDYSALTYGPSVTEVYSILALFGSQSVTPFLPGLSVTSGPDKSIMNAADTMPVASQLLDYQCRWNSPINQFSCLFTPFQTCFPAWCT
ncbi:hypothetical protein ACJJIU_19875 [Microbulbifer sp. CnH-101-E]|uniref:hypothetical protein n=1 Tax=unclassified Microbulbifer TaxID=2619833 RepID=UPI004039E72E